MSAVAIGALAMPGDARRRPPPSWVAENEGAGCTAPGAYGMYQIVDSPNARHWNHPTTRPDRWGDAHAMGWFTPSLVRLASDQKLDKCLAMLNRGEGNVSERDLVRAAHDADSYRAAPTHTTHPLA
eukprot:scaffold7956_cov124-Isochrysis_galbana.AAC.3